MMGFPLLITDLSILLRSTVADRLNTCLWLVLVLFWTWQDTVATQRLIKLKEKIDFDYLVQSQPLIKLTDQIGFSYLPSIHDLLSLSLSRSPSSISCPSFEELLCPSSVSVLLGFLSFFFFEG